MCGSCFLPDRTSCMSPQTSDVRHQRADGWMDGWMDGKGYVAPARVPCKAEAEIAWVNERMRAFAHLCYPTVYTSHPYDGAGVGYVAYLENHGEPARPVRSFSLCPPPSPFLSSPRPLPRPVCPSVAGHVFLQEWVCPYACGGGGGGWGGFV